jgi:hypothetical protein
MNRGYTSPLRASIGMLWDCFIFYMCVVANLIALLEVVSLPILLCVQTQRSRVRFPGTPQDFSEGVGSGTGSTQPRDRIN